MYTRQPPWVFVPGRPVDYSKPTASPSPAQLARLAGFDVDVMRGLGGNAFRVLDNEELLFDELRAGRLDAVLADSFYVRWRSAREGWLRVVGEPLNRLGYHFGVHREDAALLERVNAALEQMLATGYSARRSRAGSTARARFTGTTSASVATAR
jgi:ABC-type amino acid transport substrate-binding protein